MPEDVIEKICAHCGRVFNWEWVGVYVQDEFFCGAECSQEKYPNAKPSRNCPIEIVLMEFKKEQP